MQINEISGGMEQLGQVIGSHRDDVLLFLASFDGVLSEYRKNPAEVRVPAARLALLKQLQRLPNVVVAVISGRTLDDLRSRISLHAGAFFAGLHGLEVVGPDFSQVRTDAIEAFRDRMAQVAAQLHEVVGHVRGVRLECKGPIVALHTRDAAPDDVVWSRFQLLSAAADLVNSASVRALRGQDVLELLPNVGHSRAEAVLAIERCIASRFDRPVFTVYIGADWPDDDAVNVTGDNHVAAVVGRRTAVGHRLASPAELDELLAELIAQRSR